MKKSQNHRTPSTSTDLTHKGHPTFPLDNCQQSQKISWQKRSAHKWPCWWGGKARSSPGMCPGLCKRAGGRGQTQSWRLLFLAPNKLYKSPSLKKGHPKPSTTSVSPSLPACHLTQAIPFCLSSPQVETLNPPQRNIDLIPLRLYLYYVYTTSKNSMCK